MRRLPPENGPITSSLPKAARPSASSSSISARSGAGKVHVIVHDRLMELDAVTTGPEIASGSDVLVTDVVSSDTVIVAHAQPLLSEISDVQ